MGGFKSLITFYESVTIQFTYQPEEKDRNSSSSVTHSLHDLNFSENDKNIGLTPTLAYMGGVLSWLK